MFCWKKKEVEVSEPKPKKQTKKLVFRDEEFNVGSTAIELTLEDGSTFVTEAIGRIDQFYDLGRDVTNDIVEPRASNPEVISSIHYAEEFIRYISKEEKTYTDKVDHPTKCVVGRVTKAQIKDTVDYIRGCRTARVVDKE